MNNGCLAQLVEQWTVNPCVAGSKPAAADNILAGFQKSEFPLLYSQVIITSYNSEFFYFEVRLSGKFRRFSSKSCFYLEKLYNFTCLLLMKLLKNIYLLN